MSREDDSAIHSDVNYTYAHRAFLQAFLTQNVMTADEIKPVLAAVLTAHNPQRPRVEGDITQQLITTTIQAINGRLQSYDYEIRSARDQRTKELTYALINTTSDAFTQLATAFNANEIAYIRRVLDHIFETNNTHIREIMALKNTEAAQLARPSRRNRQSQIGGNEDGENATPADPGITIQEAENVLDQLVNQGFFQESRKGYYSLAPRALMELRNYLKETYNEAPDAQDDADDDQGTIRIRDCEGCREIVTYGIRCNERNCGVRWHDACANQYFRNQRGQGRKLCPKCKTECTGDVFVGERADQVQARGGGRRRTSGFAQEDEEEDG